MSVYWFGKDQEMINNKDRDGGVRDSDIRYWLPINSHYNKDSGYDHTLESSP